MIKTSQVLYVQKRELEIDRTIWNTGEQSTQIFLKPDWQKTTLLVDQRQPV